MSTQSILQSFLRNKKFVRTSILFWLVLYALLMLLQYFANPSNSYGAYIQISIGLPVAMILFYLNFFLCAFFLVNNRTKYFLLSTVLFIVCMLLAFFLGQKEIASTQRLMKNSYFAASAQLMIRVLLAYLVLMLISTLYWSVTYASAKNKENLQIQLRLQNMENEKVTAEKQFLQSQINPHFLYNTLNFFYAKSLTVSPELAESVLLLSDIMRYSLEQKENSSGMVLLDDEIGHINNVIRINQYRFNHKLQIQFLISGETANVRIVPLILITLVENAFKHGELLDASWPVLIKLEINLPEQKINFLVRNKKKKGPKEKGTGIGLENTTKRLAYAYGAGHAIVINDEADVYTASIALPIFKDASI